MNSVSVIKIFLFKWQWIKGRFVVCVQTDPVLQFSGPSWYSFSRATLIDILPLFLVKHNINSKIWRMWMNEAYSSCLMLRPDLCTDVFNDRCNVRILKVQMPSWLVYWWLWWCQCALYWHSWAVHAVNGDVVSRYGANYSTTLTHVS